MPHTAPAKLTREAPAKLNLTLDIVGRRPDGFHDLRGVMQSITLADTVTLEEQAAGFTLDAAGFTPPEGVATLEERTAAAFFARIGVPRPGLRVTLDKRTPAYAGIGGGSADAAALLRLLRDRYAPDLPDAELETVGLTVGSDVPFCIRGGTCLAEGRGERLTDLAPLPRCTLVLCKPDYDLATPELFARADRTALRNRPDTDALADALARGSLDAAAALLGNVFEQVLPPDAARAVGTVKARMRELGALGASMSGSGPTVFGLFRDADAARTAAAELGRTYRATYLAEPLARFGGAAG